MNENRASNRKNESPGGVVLQLFDPRRGDVAFRMEPLAPGTSYFRPQRCNYFTILFVEEGAGHFHAGISEHAFRGPALLFSNPYQTFFVAAASSVRGVVLQFHANFFCIETYHEAVGCNGVLFNDVYGQPLVSLDADAAAEFRHLATQMEREVRVGGLAHNEALIAFLKVFLIAATRLKLGRDAPAQCEASATPHPVLVRLTELIEQQFRTMHSPADYATVLHITPKALGKLVKAHFGRTTTELIRDCLLKHAKWQLLHTRLSVKEIAGDLGFPDEFYFSRLFKQETGFSPTAFREFETAIRGGSNLSM